MKKLLTAMVLGCFLAVGVQAHALSITPGGAVMTGDQTAQPAIDSAIASTLGLSVELYKQNVGGAESGILAGSYETLFFDTPTDPSGATITYTGGDILGDMKFLLVKDGNQNPAWYLFNLTTLGWDGVETLELSAFWPAGGAISHVTLYGSSSPPAVPEPGTLLLLGGGLLGLAVYGRRRMK